MKAAPLFRNRLVAGLLPLLGLAIIAAAYQTSKGLPLAHTVTLVPGIGREVVVNIVASPDGNRLVTTSETTAGKDGITRLWSAATQRVVAGLTGHDHQVEQALFSNDGKVLVTASSDAIQAWNPITSRLLGRFLAPEGGVISCAAVQPNGASLVAGTSTGELIFASPDSPAQAVHKPIAKSAITALAYRLDGSSLFVGTAAGQLLEIEVPSLKVVRTLRKSGSPVIGLVVAPKDEQLLMTTADDLCAVIEVSGGEFNPSLEFAMVPSKQSSNRSHALFVAKDQSCVILARKDGTMELYDRKTGEDKFKVTGHTLPIDDLKASPDGLHMATLDRGGPLLLWDFASGTVIKIARAGYTTTAISFSSDNKVLWIGYNDGSLNRYDLASGVTTAASFSAVQTVLQVGIAPNGVLWTEYTDPLIDPAHPDTRRYAVWSAQNPNEPGGIYSGIVTEGSFSPDNHYAILKDADGGGWQFYDYFKPDSRKDQLTHLKPVVKGVSWQPNSAHYLAWGDASAYLFDVSVQDELFDWKFAEGSHIDDSVVSPDGKVVASSGVKLGDGKLHAVLWGSDTGKFSWDLGIPGPNARLAYSADGSVILVNDGKEIEIFDSQKGDHLADLPGVNFPGKRPIYNSDYSKISLLGPSLNVWNVKTRKKILDLPDQRAEAASPGSPVSGDGHFAVRALTNSVELWNLDTQAKVSTMLLQGQVRQAFFPGDGLFVVTVDAADGVAFWDVSTPSAPKRTGTFTQMQDGGWLVQDSDGRYDSNDPSGVQGASYVLAWPGGLEPIEVSQLKSRFYEPGLLAKLFEIDKEPRRTVPDLNSLTLYPDLALVPDPKTPDQVFVEARERDKGGIGTVEVALNGKRILSRDGIGYFAIDLTRYRSFYLPQSLLPKGGANVLTVKCTNGKGDLTSPTVSLSLPEPPELQAPPARLFALCVGAGKYVGNASNLAAPPRDAIDMGTALKTVAGRLLKGTVDVTVLTTESTERPTRQRILDWFADIAKRATSSDIVAVFFAGHGTNAIGEHRDYFFLTPDCDPSDVTPAILGVATISGTELQEALAKIPASKQVVILDTCHSGSASRSLMSSSRSLSGDYQRAYESIRDGTGTWLLAGSASDQLSYESNSVDHGMLTYALLEAIDEASAEGLRKSESGDLFVDVEGWLKYAVGRVESLKDELGVPGIQRPEFKRSSNSASFDLGVTTTAHRGELGLKPPRPIVIMGTFSKDEEDPLKLEALMGTTFKDSNLVKPWFEVAAHPGALRVAGTYEVNGEAVTLKVFIQRFEHDGSRKTLQTITLKSTTSTLPALALAVRAAVEELAVGPGAKPAEGTKSLVLQLSQMNGVK